tara:strand:- start:3 stop:305 length:303 start_codon:yes stop_codon:yes gene_type:complete
MRDKDNKVGKSKMQTPPAKKTATVPPPMPSKQKKKKKKCEACRKRLSLCEQQLKCKCCNLYCTLHRHDHNCTYNYKEAHASFLKKTLEECKIVNYKMDKL